MKWQKCPICEGHGFVPGGFYYTTPYSQGYSSVSTEQCRTCLGTGKILEAPDWSTNKEEE
jgi:DnaJ-class molecular chaperone